MFSENVRLSGASLKKDTVAKHPASSAHLTAEALENKNCQLQVYLPEQLYIIMSLTYYEY